MFNSVRVINTLRLFIDLINILHFDDDRWTSGSFVSYVRSEGHEPDTREGNADDVFLWALETLGPYQWQCFDEALLQTSLHFCVGSETQEQTQRLLELHPRIMNARERVNGYTLLHQNVVHGDYVIRLLNMGANVNTVGFDPDWSPKIETPISLSMYRADTIMELQQALKCTGSKDEDVFDQELKTYTWPCSLGRENLVELFSEDLNLSPILNERKHVCPYCSYEGNVIVQPFWMRILESIQNRISP